MRARSAAGTGAFACSSSTSPPSSTRASRSRAVCTPWFRMPTAAMIATPRVKAPRRTTKLRLAPRRSRRPMRKARVRSRERCPHVSAAIRSRSTAPLGEPAAIHGQAPAATRGETGVVGDQQQRHAPRRTGGEDQVDHGPAGVAVEIAGGLVGQQQPWPVDQGAGQGHALLLATRQLARIVGHALPEPDLGEQRACRREGVAVAGELQRQRHVLERGHGRDQMEGLEQDADPVAPKQGQPVLVETAQIDAVDLHPAGARPLDPADDRHQAGLAGARGTHHAYAGAGLDHQIDAAQDRHRPRGARKGKMHVDKLDHRQEPDPPSAGGSRRRTAGEMGRASLAQQGIGAAGLPARHGRVPPHRPGPAGWRCSAIRWRPGYGVAEADAFPVRLEQALQRARRRVHGAECRRLRRHLGRRPRAAGLGAGRSADAPAGRAGRQRRTARTAGRTAAATISTKLF